MLVVDRNIVEDSIERAGVADLSKISIRELVALVSDIESRTGVNYSRMEMGVPGLPAYQVGVDAEIEALKSGVASKYPPIDGVEKLKLEGSLFAKNFIDLDIDSAGIVPSVGSMQGVMASLMTLKCAYPDRDKVLFFDPGFPVQKLQVDLLELSSLSFDFYENRGDKLKGSLSEALSGDDVLAIVYSTPNNPSWTCLTDSELKVIGELSNSRDVVVIEDLAYFGMDSRVDISTPAVAPYQLSVGHYADNYIVAFSGSKLFSYAGQRMGLLMVSNGLYLKEYGSLQEKFNEPRFGKSLIYRVLYGISSGTSHSAQYGMAAMLEAVNSGIVNLVSSVKEYSVRAKALKEAFLDNGFYITYNRDLDLELADGFYFTVGRAGFSEGELIQELLCYGISAIPLSTTGSRLSGIRACVSLLDMDQIEEVRERLNNFNQDCYGKN